MPKKFRVIKARELIVILCANGFVLRRTKSSHHIFTNRDKTKRVTVPVHGNKDLLPDTFRSIVRQSGLPESLFG
jgi:predicted RNA binding protein YcfA (HicA-like mRNA interferase family)